MIEQTTSRLSFLRTSLEAARASVGLSGLALAVAYGSGPAHTITVGADDKGQALSEDSLFPIASVTKLAVALAILRLSDQGLLSVDDPLQRFVPDAAAAPFGVTLKQLLTFTAGLPAFPNDAWTYDISLTWQTEAQAALKVAPTISVGTRVAYSDVNYPLLAVVIERIRNQPFQAAVKELVLQPLGIEAYLGLEPPRVPAYVTDPPDQYVGASIEMWNSAFWRSLGMPGNGVVATPAATLALIRAYRGLPEGFLRPDTLRAAVKDQTGGVGGGFPWQEWDWCPWGLGPWMIVENMNHYAFPDANPGTLSVTGYSGCAVFADPIADVAWSFHGTETFATGRIQSASLLIGNAVLASTHA
ncbi:MAG: serine hydrolase domain-containing protein [Anaerolineae bacterium]